VFLVFFVLITYLKETDDYHLAVHNVPGEKAYATSDLFEPHPTRPGLWKMYAHPLNITRFYSAHLHLLALDGKTT
jgi:hypothetical protein